MAIDDFVECMHGIPDLKRIASIFVVTMSYILVINTPFNYNFERVRVILYTSVVYIVFLFIVFTSSVV